MYANKPLENLSLYISSPHFVINQKGKKEKIAKDQCICLSNQSNNKIVAENKVKHVQIIEKSNNPS